jgi:tape measure domain-containing protein
MDEGAMRKRWIVFLCVLAGASTSDKHFRLCCTPGFVLCGIFAALLSFPAASEQTRWIAPDEVSLGAVRVTDDWLRQNGLPDTESETLIAWMHDTGTLTDENLRRATIALVIMLRNGAVDLRDMNSLCAAAPRCVDYMAEGAAFNRREMIAHLRSGDLEARTALRKMFAVADLNHRGKNESSIVQEARQLNPSLHP